MAAFDSGPESDFKRLKAVCVPLLGSSRLTPASSQSTLNLLTSLTKLLSEIPSESLTSSLISYVFLPLSTILQRNKSSEIPNQILEKILTALALLCESWWWTCDIKVWEQIFMLAGAVIGGIDESSGHKRDDETKTAAARCLVSLLRPRSEEEALKRGLDPTSAHTRLQVLQADAQKSNFVPIAGQTLDSVLTVAFSFHLPLQRAALDVAYFIIDVYLPDRLVPSVLPGVVSTMCKICLGQPQGKGWANGEIVAQALTAMEVVITKAIGDDACVRDGAVRRIDTLEDLVSPPAKAHSSEAEGVQVPHGTPRTESWLRGSASQLHIAINSLSSLQSHPTPSALLGLAKFSAAIIRSTSLTLPQTQPLLLSFLLSLSLSDYPSVSAEARQSLIHLLITPSDAQLSLQHTIMKILSDTLSALPRLLLMQADSRVTHAAGVVTAVCHLATSESGRDPPPIIVKGVRKLVGPAGGIEKWGWGLLSVLEIVEPPVVVTRTSGAQLSLEDNPETPEWINFPSLIFSNIASHETSDVLKGMFHALGAAGGDTSLFAVEWFVGVGRSTVTSNAVAALWCACRLLEGMAHFSLDNARTITFSPFRASRRLEKEARALAKSTAEIWDQSDTLSEKDRAETAEDDQSYLVQHQKGVIPLDETLKITLPSSSKAPKLKHQPLVHRALCLQLIAVTAGISQARFAPLFIHILYPVLHSLVSPLSFLSSTALATLNFITVATSYASPANLLLSNFDYVLDSVSRRLTERWLDIDATKVLSIMIRLVGADVVDRAGDVVEECFDRLDEYHGYGVIVDGLIEVLLEVIKVIKLNAKENEAKLTKLKAPASSAATVRRVSLDDFFSFLPNRFQTREEMDNIDYGPAPRRPWGEQMTVDEPIDEEGPLGAKPNQPEAPPPTPVQALTKQILSRSLYFLTHSSPTIRARILKLLALSIPVLPESALLPSIHSAWPFILNRLADPETFVVSAAAALVEELAKHVGDFMFQRVWDDIWPRFRKMLRALESGDATSALARRAKSGVGTESAYTHSHRLYRSILKTMTFALQGVREHEASLWEIIVIFRTFLATSAHQELQQCAVALYIEAGKLNPDSVWLALSSTVTEVDPVTAYLKADWDVKHNVELILNSVH
ncbi:hypothetical protein CVT26_005406 [Gymnopilus dilepis]|uniref:TEL2-interacting protein 1 n=1 Tax=Gymnopilus dilepis TaxID=231916 RepID=A0A409WGT1_9AGAR|nr:hypothetical protein CVT26_005406 [Gymnopilus dilepis]